MKSNLLNRQSNLNNPYSPESIELMQNLANDAAIGADIKPFSGVSDLPKGPQFEAVKYDQGKPDFSMISLELMEAVAKVREFGAKKYDRNNWKKGFKVTRSCAAALRHIFKFLSGETLDPESGLSHLAHAVCSLEHAIYDMVHHPTNDDR